MVKSNTRVADGKTKCSYLACDRSGSLNRVVVSCFNDDGHIRFKRTSNETAQNIAFQCKPYFLLQTKAITPWF